MTTEVVLLIACCLVIALLIVFRKQSFVKNYWRYALVLIPAIVILVLRILSIIKKPTPDQSSTQSSTLKDQVTDIKSKLNEVDTVVKIEAALAKQNNDQKMKELKEVQQIKDDRERRRRLTEMIG